MLTENTKADVYNIKWRQLGYTVLDAEYRAKNARRNDGGIIYSMGLPTFYGKGPHRLLRAGSVAARGYITVNYIAYLTA
jgi:hypothetical protein